MILSERMILKAKSTVGIRIAIAVCCVLMPSAIQLPVHLSVRSKDHKKLGMGGSGQLGFMYRIDRFHSIYCKPGHLLG